MKTVCITGGTGFVGREVVAAFLKEGFMVRALVRSNNSAAKLRDLTEDERSRLTFIIGDPCNDADIAIALQGSTALVHLVGIRRHEAKATGRSYEDVDVASAIAAVSAMKKVGLKRILLLSAADIGKSYYVRSKAKAEAAVMNSDLDWTILRPAFITGPTQRWPILLTPLLWFLGLLPNRIGDIARRARNISRKKLAEAFVHLIDNAHPKNQIFVNYISNPKRLHK